jgi:hypothetical protein
VDAVTSPMVDRLAPCRMLTDEQQYHVYSKFMTHRSLFQGAGTVLAYYEALVSLVPALAFNEVSYRASSVISRSRRKRGHHTSGTWSNFESPCSNAALRSS